MTTSLRLLTFSLLPTLGACIVYDDRPCDKTDEDGRDLPGAEDGDGDIDGDGNADNDGDPDGDNDGEPDDEPVDPDGDGFWLDPDTALPGEELIAGLHSEAAFDWSQVVEVHFYGPVRPCAFEPRADELLITLLVDEDAAPGPVDMLLELGDGSATWIAGPLTVVAPDGEPVDETPASPCE